MCVCVCVCVCACACVCVCPFPSACLPSRPVPLEPAGLPAHQSPPHTHRCGPLRWTGTGPPSGSRARPPATRCVFARRARSLSRACANARRRAEASRSTQSGRTQPRTHARNHARTHAPTHSKNFLAERIFIEQDFRRMNPTQWFMRVSARKW